MIKTKYWLSVLAISVVLIAGSLAVIPIAIADDDDDDDEDDDDDDNAGVQCAANEFLKGDGTCESFSVHIHSTTFNTGVTAGTGTGDAFCSADETRLSGGYLAKASFTNLLDNGPIGGFGWRVSVQGSMPDGLTTFVLCTTFG